MYTEYNNFDNYSWNCINNVIIHPLQPIFFLKNNALKKNLQLFYISKIWF